MDLLRAAAFGDRPGADVWWALSGSERERWLAAVVLGGQGRYAAAATVLTGLLRSGDHLIASLAASTLASHRRQLGGHAEARKLDALALHRAAGPPGRASVARGRHHPTDLPNPISPPPDPAHPADLSHPTDHADLISPPHSIEPADPVDPVDPDGVDMSGAWADALLGLAADALGAGRVAEARLLHSRVIPAGWPSRVIPAGWRSGVTPIGWRSRVRHGWVAAEIELASGCPEAAVGPAEAALATAEAAGAMRHVLKSRLVLGTALVVWGTPGSVDRGTRLLSCDLNHTDCHGLFSLIWPTAFVLSTSPAIRTSAEIEKLREIAANALSCVLLRADPISRRIAVRSPWIPTALLRSGEPPNADPETNFLTD